MLKDKVAVVYGAGGAIGGAVARGFAAEGARLFLTGRHRAPVEAVAKDIVSADGSAEVAEVDVLDEQAVDRYLRYVVGQADRIDISFDAIGIPGSQILGVPATDLDTEAFSLPIATYTTSYFVTARLAARHMIPNRTGVIMTGHRLPGAQGDPAERGLRRGDGRQGGPAPGTCPPSSPRTASACSPCGRTAWRRRTRCRNSSRFAPAASGMTWEQLVGSWRAADCLRRVVDRVEETAQRGGLHGIRQSQRDDGNHRQPDHGDPR